MTNHFEKKILQIVFLIWMQVSTPLCFIHKQLTEFENHRKSLIQHCERSKLLLQIYVDKSLLKMPEMVFLSSFWKPEAYG